MNRTQIEWVRNPDGTQGYTFNPITGCLNNCPYCYARKLANGRLKARYRANENLAPTPRDLFNYSLDPFYPRYWHEKLCALPGGKPKGIFVCDMSDLFGIGIPHEWQARVIAQIRKHTQHRFYLLTKQPQNLIKWSPFPDNCWVGVSATTEDMYWHALRGLKPVEAKVKFLSFEPLQGRVMKPGKPDYGDAGEMTEVQMLQAAGINWLIVGAQTKPYKPPLKIWVNEIIEVCKRANIPYFLKDNLRPLMGENLIQDIPKGEGDGISEEALNANINR